MGHVHHEIGPHAVGDVGQDVELDGPGIGRGAGHDHLGPHLLCLAADGFIIHVAVFLHTVADEVEILARQVHGAAVGQMAALGQIHAHDGIAGLQQGEIHGGVGLGAGMGLHVGILRAEEPAGPVDGDLFHLVHELAAAVVPFAGIALGVFIGQHAAHGGHDRRADDILAGDQLDILALARQLALHGGGDFGVRPAHQADGVHHRFIHIDFSFFPPRKTGSGKPHIFRGPRRARCYNEYRLADFSQKRKSFSKRP